jgi:predicted acetyltransferase
LDICCFAAIHLVDEVPQECSRPSVTWSLSQNQVSSAPPSRTIEAMDFEIRPIADTDEDWERFWPVLEAAFGETTSEGEAGEWRANFEFDRSLAAFDGERIVGTGGAYTMELTLPGLTAVPVGGLTAIAVLPTHRRRGILSAIIDRHLRDVEAHGEPMSVLIASESAIYGRFGYGPATWGSRLEIDTSHGAFLDPPETPGRLRMLDSGEGAKLLPPFYDRARRAQPGELTRSSEVWASYFRDPEWWRHGASKHYDVVYETPGGTIDGWLSYRVENHWDGELPANAVRVRDLHALTPAARTALWRYCLDIDLASSVKLITRPVDDPLRWLLADSRRLRTTQMHDDLWVRLLDLPVALAARRYATHDRLVLEVVDQLRPANHGCFALEGGPDGASCERTGDDTDLRLNIAELGAAYLGGVRFATLAAAGRVIERTPGALRRADRLFASDPAPFCTTSF